MLCEGWMGLGLERIFSDNFTCLPTFPFTLLESEVENDDGEKCKRWKVTEICGLI